LEVILDTNALSALADGDEALAGRLADTPLPAVPVVVLGEYRYGIRGSRHRAQYESWLADNLPGFAVLPVDATTASVYAELRHELRSLGKPIPENDIWIAALSRQHRLPVLSRDRHFSLVPRIVHLDW
jgi:predicted nucleic acid-binding protein